MNEKLQKVIDEAIQENTFNLSAVEAIKAMRDQNEMLLGKSKALETTNEELRQYNKKIETKCVDYETKRSELRIREDAVTKREIEITKLECLSKQSEAVATAYKDCFGLVFRNQHVHRAISGQVPVPGGTNYSPQVMYTQTNETESVS